jgi:hypothetical protein
MFLPKTLLHQVVCYKLHLVVKMFLICVYNGISSNKISPETFAETAVFEFSVTQFGLEEQLLNLVILREKDNLENKP